MTVWTGTLSICLAATVLVVQATASDAGPSPRQQVQVPDDLSAAEAHFRAQEWRAALELYQRALEGSPSDAKLLDRAAHCAHRLGDYTASLAAWEKLAGVDPQRAVVHYNIACASARLGHIDPAFAALERAVSLGFKDASTLSGDVDLAALRSDPRFGELQRKLRTAGNPPPAEIEQFAFWIGNWDVFSRNGAPAGSSRIERILGGHVILENWTGSDGMQGKSFNTYDVAGRRWQQRWVDDSGNLVDFDQGHFADGVMTFEMGWKQPDGTLAQRRMTFTDLAGQGVRQHSQRSVDGGATWTEEYELFYRPAVVR